MEERPEQTARNPTFISKSVGEEGYTKIKQCLHNCGFSDSSQLTTLTAEGHSPHFQKVSSALPEGRAGNRAGGNVCAHVREFKLQPTPSTSGARLKVSENRKMLLDLQL